MDNDTVTEREFDEALDIMAQLAQRRYKDGKKAGRKEVVDWMRLHKAYLMYDDVGDLWEIKMLDKEWQKKLKEWGI